LSLPHRVERILEMLDRGAAAAFRPDDRHDVKPCRVLKQSMPLHKGDRQTGQLALLYGIDGIGWMADFLRGTGLDLDKDDRPAVQGHKIKLAGSKPSAAGENLIAQ